MSYIYTTVIHTFSEFSKILGDLTIVSSGCNLRNSRVSRSPQPEPDSSTTVVLATSEDSNLADHPILSSILTSCDQTTVQSTQVANQSEIEQNSESMGCIQIVSATTLAEKDSNADSVSPTTEARSRLADADNNADQIVSSSTSPHTMRASPSKKARRSDGMSSSSAIDLSNSDNEIEESGPPPPKRMTTVRSFDIYLFSYHIM